MEQLRPIFEALRQREELPCSYPLHVGSTHGTKQAFIYGHSRSQGSTTPGPHHYTHHHGYQPSPGYQWVMLIRLHVKVILHRLHCLSYFFYSLYRLQLYLIPFHLNFNYPQSKKKCLKLLINILFYFQKSSLFTLNYLSCLYINFMTL